MCRVFTLIPPDPPISVCSSFALSFWLYFCYSQWWQCLSGRPVPHSRKKGTLLLSLALGHLWLSASELLGFWIKEWWVHRKAAQRLWGLWMGVPSGGRWTLGTWGIKNVNRWQTWEALTIEEKVIRTSSEFVSTCVFIMKIKLQMILEKSADNDDDYSCWSNKARKKAKKKNRFNSA